jgi:oligopeptide transport system substrate-binding protein
MLQMKRQNLRSSVALALLLALIIPILAACGGTPPTAQPTAAPAPAAEQPTAAAPAAEATTAPAEQATAAAAEQPAETAAPTAGGKVLRVHQITFPDVVDPQKSSFTNEIAVLILNYEGLTRLDKDSKTVPAAAEKWEFNADGTELTFHLREGLKYSDGSPLTAENFRYAVERTCDPATAGEYQSILFEIKGCQEFASTPVTDTAKLEEARGALGATAPDERTLVLTLTQPAPYYPTIAGLWVFYPAKKDLIEKGGENWWRDPKNQIGNGPFQMTQFTEDQLVSFESNENYWAGRPKLDGFEYVYQKDTSVALEAYKAGQLDVMQPDSSQLPALNSDATLSKELLNFPAAWTSNIGFNLTLEPWQDKKVREAFSYALDRQTYCEQINNGTCIPTLSWIPPGLPGSIETDKYGFDPEKAKQALAESSYGGPENLPPIELSYNADDPAQQPRMEWIAGQFRDILGVEVKLNPMEGKAWVAARKDVKTFPQMGFPVGWIQDYPDPQNWLSVYWTCDATFAQRMGYCNEQFDELVKKGDVELDPAKRLQYYEQAGQLLVDDVPGPFAYNPANVFLVKPNVSGYDTTPSDVEWPGEFASALTIDISK